MPIVDINSSSYRHSFCAGIIDPDGDLLALGDRSDEVTLWSAKTGKLLRMLGTLKGSIKTPAFPADNRPRIGSLEGINTLAFATNGKRIVAANRNGIRIWDVETGVERPGPVEAIDAAAFGADGRGCYRLRNIGPCVLADNKNSWLSGTWILSRWNVNLGRREAGR